ncbi:probable inactive serine/threonine-protein kinase scy2 [Trifolium pratense]|uniref:Uncharacterized protein n=1 Tax=Trifolium pratense TaxID=57577 RepID=A0ACB0K765_TRIPR|nr:probable inactive serine/threonine-protein kinase scy2 [Trifolium pratense]CAJ2651527.1 unnamed protein product [Trifolium pratense]
MAVELCSENCGVSSVSPRISFSQDFSQTDSIPIEQHPFRSNSSGLNSSIDFDFCINQSLNLESSSAEELFSDGRILATEIKKKNVPLKQPLTKSKTQSPPPNPPLNHSYSTHNNDSNGKIFTKETNKETNEVCEKQSSNSKSFWSFKRSSSCGSGYGRSLCPLPLLSRSNSTGSSTSSVNSKKNSLSKEGISVKSNSQKHSTTRFSNSSGPNSYLKPPLNKSHGSHGSVRVNPILNVPPANLFGLSSIFSNNRDKSKKK